MNFNIIEINHILRKYTKTNNSREKKPVSHIKDKKIKKSRYPEKMAVGFESISRQRNITFATKKCVY